MKEYLFKTEMEVRDYECDIQGIVNNANYLHYLEATRHKFIQSLGLSFKKLHDDGMDVVVSEIEIKYRTALTGDDKFLSCLNYHRDGIRLVFEQDIYRLSDMKLCVKAKTSTVAVINEVLSKGDEMEELLKCS
jgi:acyl-CoA thioester hydrolase